MFHSLRSMNDWVACPVRTPRARLRLLCFPYTGSGASIFRSWSQYLPADIEVCPIQLPGRENRLQEPVFTRLLPLVQTLVRVLDPILDIPVAIFGHSMGVLMSFELARQLRRQNCPQPIHLIVSGSRAPQLTRKDPSIHRLPEDQLVHSLQTFNGTLEIVHQNPELMELLLPVIRADFAICETYV